MNEQSIEQAPVEQILYDANADQRIPFYIEDDGERFEVAFILGPQTDEALTEYDRQCDRRMVQADQQETGERNAIESVSKEFEASLWLCKDRLLDVEGFGEPGEAKPDDWKDLIGDDKDLVAVVDEAYLAAMIVSPPVAKPGKTLKWRRQRTEIIPLKAIFNGCEVTLTHERQAELTSDHLADYNGIMRSRWLVQGTRVGTPETRVPPKAARLGRLYDQLKYKTTGYAGRVPMHHKAIVVMHDLGKAGEAVRKNLNGSPTQ